MNSLLSSTDLVIFFGSLIAVMGMGLWVGRKEDSSEDYFLAGRKTRWWGVAGSIFGSNVSANHIVAAVALLDWYLTVPSSEPPKSPSNGTKLLPLGAKTTGSLSERCAESVQRYVTVGEDQRLLN